MYSGLSTYLVISPKEPQFTRIDVWGVGQGDRKPGGEPLLPERHRYRRRRADLQSAPGRLERPVSTQEPPATPTRTTVEKEAIYEAQKELVAMTRATQAPAPTTMPTSPPAPSPSPLIIFNSPSAIGVHPITGEIYVVETGSNTLKKFKVDGKLLEQSTSRGVAFYVSYGVEGRSGDCAN